MHTESTWNKRANWVFAGQSEREMKEWITAFKVRLSTLLLKLCRAFEFQVYPFKASMIDKCKASIVEWVDMEMEFVFYIEREVREDDFPC